MTAPGLPETRPKVSVLGCDIDPLTLAETVAAVDRLIRARRPTQHCAINASKVVLVDQDERLRDIVAGCALVNADGQSVVWASRLLGRPLPERVTGIDLFAALLELAADRGYGVFFLGARAEVLKIVVERAARDHPSLHIAGSQHGYFFERPSDGATVIAAIRAAEPDILFVGISSPRKEYWLSEHLEELGVPFSMGVGGSFDVYAGDIRRAPAWMQRTGTEWLYRFAQEPTRMWRRYLLGNAAFLALFFRYYRQDVCRRTAHHNDRSGRSGDS